MTGVNGRALDLTSLVSGEELPAVGIPLTRTFIVAAAIASRDFQDVHHDPELAVARGSKDIFMNILTSNGLVERYVREVFGPRMIIRRIRIRLGAPNYPGDAMNLSGSVTAVRGPEVEVQVKGENSLGVHVSGTVIVDLGNDIGGSRS